MGSYATAILCFGMALDPDVEEHPWENEEYGEFDEWVTHTILGDSPFDQWDGSYEDWRKYLDSNPEAKAAYTEYLEQSRDVLNTIGVEVVLHGYQWEQAALIVKGTLIRADWGEASRVDPNLLLELSNKWANPNVRVAEQFCRDNDIAWAPEWILLARYG